MAESPLGLASKADLSLFASPERFQKKLSKEKNAYSKDKIVKTWFKAVTYGDGKEKGVEITEYKNGNVKSRLAWLSKKGVVVRGTKPKNFGK